MGFDKREGIAGVCSKTSPAGGTDVLSERVKSIVEAFDLISMGLQFVADVVNRVLSLCCILLELGYRLQEAFVGIVVGRPFSDRVLSSGSSSC
jgi:hypothetical protein